MIRIFMEDDDFDIYMKEQIEKGTDIPTDLFGLYSGFKTKISK